MEWDWRTQPRLSHHWQSPMLHAHEQGTLWLLKIEHSPSDSYEQALATAEGIGF